MRHFWAPSSKNIWTMSEVKWRVLMISRPVLSLSKERTMPSPLNRWQWQYAPSLHKKVVWGVLMSSVCFTSSQELLVSRPRLSYFLSVSNKQVLMDRVAKAPLPYNSERKRRSLACHRWIKRDKSGSERVLFIPVLKLHPHFLFWKVQDRTPRTTFTESIPTASFRTKSYLANVRT